VEALWMKLAKEMEQESLPILKVYFLRFKSSEIYESKWMIVESGILFPTYEKRVIAKHCTYVQRIRFHHIIKKEIF